MSGNVSGSVRPLVSTLICTYNAEKFLSRTLDSVLNQTYSDQEILIFDDVSTDDTLKILREYQEKYPQIVIFADGKKRGAYAGLNHLLDNAKGTYIAIQDHDDIWHPEKLERQIEFLESHPEYVGSGTGTLMYYSKSRIGYLTDTKRVDTTRVIHTSLVFRNIGVRYNTDQDFLSDGYFMQNVLTENKKVLAIQPEVLTLHYYKQTGTNYSELRFKVTKKHIRRYFDVYGYGWYAIFILVYLLCCQLLPTGMKNAFDFFLVRKLKHAQPKEILEQDGYCRALLKYY